MEDQVSINSGNLSFYDMLKDFHVGENVENL